MNRIYVIGRDSLPSVVTLDSGETLEFTLVALPGVSEQVSVEIRLNGEGASLKLYGLYVCNSDEKLGIKVTVRHNAGHCTSSQLFKGVVGGAASATFDGLIHVAANAAGTSANQQNHSLLLSSEASAESRPQLEIYADDVECSHGATSGYLNADEQFYMRSRGIPEEEAKRLQVISFIAPVLSRLDDDMQEEILSAL